MRRHKLLTQGGLQVVSYIDKLPKTTHDLNSFTMDIVLATVSFDYLKKKRTKKLETNNLIKTIITTGGDDADRSDRDVQGNGRQG